MIHNYQIVVIFGFLQMQCILNKNKYLCCNEIGVLLCVFLYVVNERNFVLTFLHSGIRLYYNQYIQSKVIIQPEESDTTLYLYCVMFSLFSPTIVFSKGYRDISKFCSCLFSL